MQEIVIKGTSLMVQQQRLHAFPAGGAGSIPGQGTKISHAVWLKKKILIKIIYFFKFLLKIVIKHLLYTTMLLNGVYVAMSKTDMSSALSSIL